MSDTERAQIVYLQYGGKASMAKWIVSYFPEHKVYLEPFCGSCSVLLAKPRSFIEIVNDADARLISMFETLREQPKELAAMLWATPYSPENWRVGKASEEELEDARLFIASGQQFYCGNGNTSTWAIDKCAAPHKPKPAVWADWSKRILPFASRLKGVQILREDAIKAIERVKDNAETLIYVDPPYLGHEKEYRFSVDYDRLVQVLRGSKAKVIVSEYEPAIERFPGWHVVRREMSGRARTGAHNTKARQKVECLIANFPLPGCCEGTCMSNKDTINDALISEASLSRSLEMELNRVVSVTVPVDASGAAILTAIAATLTATPDKRPGATAAAVAPTTEPKRGRGRPPKVEAAADLDFGDEPAAEAEAETEEAEETETEEAEAEPEEEEKPEPPKAPKLTLEKHIIPAFQAYAKKHTREKAGEILTKYKVKSVRDLPADKYAEIMKKLKV